MNFGKFLTTLFFIEHLWWLLLQIYRRELISDFFYHFKPCYGRMNLSCNMFFQVLSDTAFFLVQTWYFYHKKVVTWTLQHFYKKEVMMLAFLHRWDYCWKCEFDTDVKTENYNHHDGEQLLFYKKAHIKTQRKKKDVVEIFIILYYIIARNEEFQFIW